MARQRKICSIPLDQSLEDFSEHDCAAGTHAHISRAEAKRLHDEGLLEWLAGSMTATRKEICVVHVYEWEGPTREPATKTPHGDPLNTGLSYAVGEYLAKCVRQRKPWALVMYANQHGRPGAVDVDAFAT